MRTLRKVRFNGSGSGSGGRTPVRTGKKENAKDLPHAQRRVFCVYGRRIQPVFPERSGPHAEFGERRDQTQYCPIVFRKGPPFTGEFRVGIRREFMFFRFSDGRNAIFVGKNDNVQK